MSVVIVNVNSTTLSINGIEYLKNFMSIVTGDLVKILNTYDSKVVIQENTIYSDYTIDGGGFSSAADLQSALKDVLFTRGLEGVEARLDNLEDNQVTGVETYDELTDLPVTGTLLVSYKVTNDTVSNSNNGYYHWNGASYTKDADLVVSVLDDTDTSDGISGKAVGDYIDIEKANAVFETIKQSEETGLIDIILKGTDKNKLYRLSRVYNYNNGSSNRVLIEIKDNTNTVVCRLFDTDASDIRKDGVLWVDLEEQNSSGVSGQALLNFTVFKDAGILTFDYVFSEYIVNNRPEIIQRDIFNLNKWLRNKGQRFRTDTYKTNNMFEEEIINAIQDIIIPPPDFNSQNDEIIIFSFINNNGTNDIIQLKNITTDETMNIVPTVQETVDGVIIRELEFTGHLGNFVTLKIDYSKFINTGTILNSGFSNTSISIVIQEAVNNQWKGKKIVWIGTSIPENQNGEGANLSEKLERSYPNLLGRSLGANMINNSRQGLASAMATDGTIKASGSLTATVLDYNTPAINPLGAPITGGDLNRNELRSFENAMLGQNADLYVFDIIPNNTEFGTSVWDTFTFTGLTWDSGTFETNRHTLLGSVIFLINELWTENPLARVTFVSTFENDEDGFADYETAVNVLEIPHIKLREKLGANNYSWHTNNEYYVDPVHPSQYGQYKLSEILFGELLKIG